MPKLQEARRIQGRNLIAIRRNRGGDVTGALALEGINVLPPFRVPQLNRVPADASHDQPLAIRRKSQRVACEDFAAQCGHFLPPTRFEHMDAAIKIGDDQTRSIR